MQVADENNTPPVSIIIAAYNAEEAIQATLRSVMAQDWEEGYEVIVADSSSDRTPDLIRQEFPAVHLLHREIRMQSGMARNLGLSVARGQILAFTDSGCIVPRDWIRQLAAHHRQRPDYAAIGGAIVNGNPKSIVSWAGYLAEFNIHLPVGDRPYDTNHIPTNNISYKRWVFERYGGFPGNDVIKQVDLLFNRMLHFKGERILCVPSLQVAHFHRTRMGDYLSHQRDIGQGTIQAMRRLPRIQGSWLARHPRLGIALLPGVVLVKFARNSARFITWSPETVGKHPGMLPLFMLGLGWWSLGFAHELLRGEQYETEWSGNRDLRLGQLLSNNDTPA